MEWKEFEMEAQIKAGVANELGNGIGFYAIDYLENKRYYQNETKLNVSLGGFCYVVEEAIGNYPENFTAYLPYNKKTDEYEFIGKVWDIKEEKIGGRKKSCVENKNSWIG